MKRLPFLLLFVSALCYSQTPSSSHAGNVGLEFIGNGTNNVQMLKGGECGITQIN